MSTKRILITVFSIMLIASSLWIGAYASSIDPVNVNAQANGDVGTVEPLYIAHECHPGPDHENCNYVYVEEECGCYTHGYYCCCGKLMYLAKELCPEHRY